MRLIVLLAFFPSFLFALPGQRLPDPFPELRDEGLVDVAAIDAQGGVFVKGNFDSVNGIPRPGLARLHPDGTLDLNFNPAAFEEPNITPPEFFFNFEPAGFQFTALPGGFLLIGDTEGWQLFNADGSGNETLLSQYPREGEPPKVLLTTQDRIYLQSQAAENTIIALRASDFLTDPTFTAAELPHRPSQMVRGEGDKLWILGQDSNIPITSIFPTSPQSLACLNGDGTIDESFPIEALVNSRQYWLFQGENGGCSLLSRDLSRFRYWPSPTHIGVENELRDNHGQILSAQTYSFPAYFNTNLVHVQTDGSLISRASPSRDFTRHIQGTLDTSFTIPFPAPRQFTSRPDLPISYNSLLGFSDGSLLTGGTRRYLPDGTPDPNWSVPRPERQGVVILLKPTASGEILVGGQFDRVNGAPTGGLILLANSGELSTRTIPNFDLRQLQNGAFTSDEGLVVALNQLPASTTLSISQPSNLLLFDQTGTLNELSLPGRDSELVSTFELLSDDTLLATHFQNSEVPSMSLHRWKLGSDEITTEQNGFRSGLATIGSASLRLFRSENYFFGNKLYSPTGDEIATLPDDFPSGSALLEMPDGRILFETNGAPNTNQLTLWDPSNGESETFTAGPLPVAGINKALLSSRGKILLMGWDRHDPNSSFVSNTIVRYHSTGQLDHTFRFLSKGETTMALVGENVWVGGKGLSSVEDSHATGFENWLAATSSDNPLAPAESLANADPDGDGLSNFYEYATNTNPTLARSQAFSEQVSALTFSLPCNPEAPEVIRRIEVSEDLQSWRTATGAEIRLETQEDCFQWTLCNDSEKRFSRVKFE